MHNPNRPIATSYEKAPNDEQEMWVDTFLFPGFQVSQIGRVRNLKTGRLVNPVLEGGEMMVNVQVPISLLVAYAFEPNLDPAEKPFVRHKDGVRTNNFYLNLEFSAEPDPPLASAADTEKFSPKYKRPQE